MHQYKSRMAIVAIAAIFSFGILAPASAQAQGVTDAEGKCIAKLGKAASKLASAIGKGTAKCRDGEIKGNVTGPCPDAKTQGKIDKGVAKVVKTADKSCGSTCSVSGIACIADSRCPPLPTAFEFCSAGAKGINFDMGNLNFPGPFCEAALGGEITTASDIGQCVATVTEDPANAVVDVVYGSITGGISGDAAKCLSGIGKAAVKLSATVYKGIVKCRDSINKGKLVADPADCRTVDTKLALKVDKAEAKLEGAIDSKCDDTLIQELDLCLNGVGGTTTRQDAKDCLIEAVNEITETSTLSSFRTYSPRSLVEAAYPPAGGVCGDGVANQLPNPFALLGEECDLTDDAACPGQCIPPGDVFECTCANIPRIRFAANGFTADLDNGWTGTSHNGGVADGAGYVTDITNCDCDAFTDATCTGTSVDPVCDNVGNQLPTCSWEPFSGTNCDARGTDPDTTDGDNDCFICDEFNSNAGDFCVNEADCQAQCHDANFTPTGPCTTQADCGAGEVCRGQCDRSQSCIRVPNGAPLPISSGGSPVCVVNTFRFDVFGTRNIVTGAHESNVQQFSVVRIGPGVATPCPMCGGFCVGGNQANQVCEGTCSVSGDPCRFDVDCPVSESCTSASPDCPGSTCNLSNVCSTGSFNSGGACRVEAGTSQFGTTSNDCLPNGSNISGQGLAINFLPSTSGIVDHPPILACSAANNGNFDCPCPAVGGVATKPNNCAGACNAGAEFGVGCATGNNNINGAFTTCTGGSDPVGTRCDEDSDCNGGGTCTLNPTHCVGDVAFLQFPCDDNGDCGTGTCEDACPSGRCVPLCLESDDLAAPANSLNDPEEGVCAGGPPTYHCSGDTFLLCPQSAANAGCASVCTTTCNAGTPGGGSLTPCDGLIGQCPSGEVCCGACGQAQECEAGTNGVFGTSDDVPGAGVCIPDVTNCFVNDAVAEGGTTINGKGDPTNVLTVSTYCIAQTSSPTINAVAGLPGPGRLRQEGVILTNGFTSLP